MSKTLHHSKTVLISGAGIAGMTLAYWLDKYGFEPVIIEKAPGRRSGGYMMDFFGSGLDVAEAMGIIPDLRKKHHRISKFEFINADKSRQGAFKLSSIKKLFTRDYFSIMRGELEEILYNKIKKSVPIRFNTSVKKLEQKADHVKVTFESGKTERFDLVIGADGIASRIRELTFGPHKKFMKYLGYYVGAFVYTDKKHPQTFRSSVEVNRLVGTYAIGKGKVASLLVYTSPNKGVIPPEKRKETLRKAFKGYQGLAPEVLDRLDQTDDIYMDLVTQIQMPHWSKGRVSLVGDAGACLTLLAGQGATMAMVESYILATELMNAEGNHIKAFRNYEKVLQPIVKEKQKEARDFTGSFVPKKKWTLWLYQFFVRHIHHPFVLKWVFKNFEAGSLFGKDYPMPPKGK